MNRVRDVALVLAVTAIPWSAAQAQQLPGTPSPHGPDTEQLDCSECHTPDGWKPVKASMAFDHDTASTFVLDGRHRQASCTSCHINSRFNEPEIANSDCAVCHVDVHEGNLSDNCAACHSTVAFTDVPGLEIHAKTSFPLVGAHQQVSCESCHRDDRGGAFTVLETDCLACHEADYVAAQPIDHVAVGFPTDCARCHSSLAWAHNSGLFDHVTVSRGFQLLGAHARIRCLSCHTGIDWGLVYTTTNQNECVSCHDADYVTGHQDDGFPFICADCHTNETWKGAIFDHVVTSGGFALAGAHAQLACTSCHLQSSGAVLFAAAGQNDCVSCHQSSYDTGHPWPGFPTTCLDCHTNDTWLDATFDHGIVTNGFTLVGVHAQAACTSCHNATTGAPLYTAAGPNDCISCHQSGYDTGHPWPGFPTTCLDCHTNDTWLGVTFDHAVASGGFTLRWAHARAPCTSCHNATTGAPLYTAAGPNDCISCHQSGYDTGHPWPGFPTTCLDCHTNDTWLDATFDHSVASNGFTLVGVHAQVPCTSCHNATTGAPLYTAVGPNDCISCHQSGYDTGHPWPGFPTTCLDCHTNDTWLGVTFDHAVASGGFTLRWAHARAPCTSCHNATTGAPLYAPAGPNDCISCHQSGYDSGHLWPGFPTTCLDCHTNDTWLGATFDHTAVTGGFTLVGVHAQMPCSSCHNATTGAPLYTAAGPNDCIACHQSTFDAAHWPGFPTTCLDCHTTGTWLGATFDHSAASGGFLLVGVHAQALCTGCHNATTGAPLYSATGPNDCIACHQSTFDAAHWPSFPTTCLDCHTNDTWLGPTFDHGAVTGGFPLVWAHAQAPCSSCHNPTTGTPLYPATGPNDCIACHQSDYDAAHLATGFPTSTACATCHTQDQWTGATFPDHDQQFFPIFSGVHRGRWNDCTTCHTAPNDFAIFTCFNCHEHNKSRMDDQHRGENGYVYESRACYSCHPDGRT